MSPLHGDVDESVKLGGASAISVLSQEDHEYEPGEGGAVDAFGESYEDAVVSTAPTSVV